MQIGDFFDMGNDEEFKQQVRVTASRLRLVGVDFADEDQGSRVGCLCEEIERALKSIVPDKRRAFLEQLMERFPTEWLGGQPAQGEPGTEQDKLDDPDYLVSRLVEQLPKLTPEKKNSIAADLQNAGLGLLAEKAFSDQLVQDFKAALGIASSAEIDGDRLVELVSILAKFIVSLEPKIWHVWRSLSPRSRIRRPKNLTGTLGQLVVADSKVFPGQVEQELAALGGLIMSVMAAVNEAGSQFSRQYVRRFSPSAISGLVEMEDKGGFFAGSQEAKCWRKYCELTGHLTEDSVVAEMKRIIADYVESLMQRRGG